MIKQIQFDFSGESRLRQIEMCLADCVDHINYIANVLKFMNTHGNGAVPPLGERPERPDRDFYLLTKEPEESQSMSAIPIYKDSEKTIY